MQRTGWHPDYMQFLVMHSGIAAANQFRFRDWLVMSDERIYHEARLYGLRQRLRKQPIDPLWLEDQFEDRVGLLPLEVA